MFVSAEEAAPFEQLRRVGPHPFASVGMAMGGRDLFRRVIEVSPPVRPADVVEDQHRQRRAVASRGPGKHPELVVHGVPVVIAVDERDVDRRQLRQHVVADVAVEDVATGEPLLVLGRVELGDRIDHVELGVGTEPFEHQRGRLSAQRADLDDAPRARRLEHRPDHAVPERVHATARASCAPTRPRHSEELRALLELGTRGQHDDLDRDSFAERRRSVAGRGARPLR